ncbi:FKBP-type peptidyl-prolyl cis-trans isomerase [Sulfurimonas xiamenensis]|jgi:FKBP-type peptidyl-prolyl cis-trans isomerase SlyD|uniref:Peptidyl-prolyl cis-trans isomerase n=1 Tax=Sulfurimonas xiamenensis TaxID=2590021 RepID=A0AAJ4A4E0_9BACT|nr:peptidylprolyl isomerase [Sulfurimonas xiamenensis]QFR43573.1 peptidylprolyl isomerase [Sulfurimonas xiamenensis]
MAIETNQVVSIEYEVRDGEKIVDSNVGAEPLVFMFGRGQIIPGLENAIANMSIGEKTDVLVKAEDAYGEHNAEAKQEVPKDQFAGIDLEVGMTLYGQGEDGGTIQVVVQEIGSESVIIDFNHPLAGKDLAFTVSINNIREASAEEIASGIPAENQQESCCGTGAGAGCGC